MRKKRINNGLVALLILGSAISLLSCKEHTTPTNNISRETLMSESSDSLTVVVSENGRPSYHFTTPLVEGYSLAREPYREFRKGVEIVTYLDDTVKMVDATLTANYAINYSELKLWEAKGDVVVVKHDGKNLYTQQLFWNSTTQRIYSNVDTKIVDTVTGDVYTGEGFESDEQMKEWSFRKMKGRMSVDTSPNTEPDSTSTAKPRNTETITPKTATQKMSEVGSLEPESHRHPATPATREARNRSATSPKVPSRPTPPTPRASKGVAEMQIEVEQSVKISESEAELKELIEKEQ